MANEMILSEVQQLAKSVVGSNFFPGIRNAEQALVLMMLAQAEGLSPIMAAMRYDVIDGKPAKKSAAMLGDFIAAGGKVEWHEHNAKACEATFTHPTGGTVKVRWDMARAQTAGLAGKSVWQKFPEAMLHARCVSNGVRFVYPAATGGLYDPAEVADFEPAKPSKGKALWDKLEQPPAEQPAVVAAPVQDAQYEEPPPPPDVEIYAADVQPAAAQPQQPLKLATPGVNTDRIPADVMRLSRKLVALPFAELSDLQLAAQERALKELAGKAKDADNRAVLTLLAAIVAGVLDQRGAAAAKAEEVQQ